MATEHCWTEEAMQNAIPRVKGSGYVKARHSNADIDRAQESPLNTKADFVSNTMEYPYQSIGRLFFKVGDQEYTGSAFVAQWDNEKNVLVTAAHNLYYYADEKNKLLPKESSGIVFVPAMRHDKDVYGPYGQFVATDIGWNKQWNPDEGKVADDYDFGIIHVGKQHISKTQQTDQDVGNVVVPIPTCCDPTTADTIWTTVGYPARRIDNKERKMMMQTGVYVPDKDQLAINSKISVNPFGSGSSGGPWLLTINNEKKANGVKVSEDDIMAYSPRFTEALLAKENIEMSSSYGVK